MKLHKVFYSALVCALVVNAATRADAVLISTLGQPFRDNVPIGNNPNPQPPPPLSPFWEWAAQSFTTDNNSYRLTSIDAVVGNGAASPVVVSELRKDDVLTTEIDSTPSGLITSFTAPSVLGAPSARSFTPNTNVTLEPNTTYWFLLGASGSGTYDWSYIEGSSYTGPGSIRAQNAFAQSDNSGVDWRYFALTAHPLYFQVNVEVPEPCAFALSAMGLALLPMRRFRKSDAV
jgi:hypothetical protein